MARPTSTILLAALLAPLAGCPDKDAGTGGDTTDDASSGGATTDHPTTGDASTTEATTTPTSAGEDGVWDCEDFVRADVMCFGGDAAELLAECEEGFAYIDAVLGPTCRQNYLDYAICIATSPCMPGDACAAEEAGLDCKPAPEAACSAQADKLAMCGQTPSPAETASQCQLELNAYEHDDPACGAAFEALVACQATIDCEDLGGNVGCEAEAMAWGEACPVGDE